MQHRTIVLACLLIPALVSAQKDERPALRAGADPNDPAEYYRLGESLLESHPEKAEQAYAWATRLAPGVADAWYGRYAAALLANPHLHDRLERGERKAMSSKEAIALDSLRLTAVSINPYFYSRFEGMLFQKYLQRAMDKAYNRYGQAYQNAKPELDYEMTLYMKTLGPETNGWLAYTESRWHDALTNYTSALENTRVRWYVQHRRALAFYRMGQFDSVVATLQDAIEDRAKPQKDRIIPVYESQASFEYMIGVMLDQKKDAAAAKEAYARALLSDLSFYPAHLRLAVAALAAGDTAGALSAYRTAVDIRPGDHFIRYVYGHALINAGKPAEAIVELKRATELEPHFAQSWYELARATEAQGNAEAAVPLYQKYLERAARHDLHRSAVEAKLRQALS